MQRRSYWLFLLIILTLQHQSDRAAWAEEIDWLNRGIAEYSAGQYNQAVNSLSPVSYTHLTLPTNREV